MSMPEINQFSFDDHPELLTQLEEFKKTKQQEREQSGPKTPEPLPPVDNTGPMQLVDFHEEKLDDDAKTTLKNTPGNLLKVFQHFDPSRLGNTQGPGEIMVSCLNESAHSHSDQNRSASFNNQTNLIHCHNQTCPEIDIVDVWAYFTGHADSSNKVIPEDTHIVVKEACNLLHPEMTFEQLGPNDTWIRTDNLELSVKEINELAKINDQTSGADESLEKNLFQSLEDDFWTCREAHMKIFQEALASGIAPWSLFGSVMSYIITETPWQVCLPGMLGRGPASLNTCIAMVGGSGDGKDLTVSSAKNFLQVFPYEMGESTKQGFTKAYVTRDSKGVQTWVRRNACTYIPEIDSIKPSGKGGDSQMVHQRMVFSGQALVFQYANLDRAVNLPALSYRHSLQVGVQPERGGWLFGEAGGGTPQRFIWMGMLDKRIASLPEDSDIPHLDNLHFFTGWNFLPSSENLVEMEFPDTVAKYVKSRNRIKHDVETRESKGYSPLDSHIIQVRLSVAAALAFLDNRGFVNEKDWELSEIVINISRFNRDRCLYLLDSSISRDAEKRGKEMGIAREAADAAAEEVAVKKTEVRIVELLKRNNNELKKGVIQSKMNKARQGPILDTALANLASKNLIEVKSSIYNNRETFTVEYKGD